MSAAAYGAMYGAAALLTAVYWVFILGVSALQILAAWKILVKTGEPGWKCLIPFVGPYTMFKKFWKPLYFWLTILFSVIIGVLLSIWLIAFEEGGATMAGVGFTGLVWALYAVFAVVLIVWQVKFSLGMARSFGYGGGFAAGLIFLPTIFQLILAFNNDAYQGNTYGKKPAQDTPWESEP